MKTASIPAVRVEPELRAEVESLLNDGETLSEFVEDAVRASLLRRRHQAEFVARGLRSLQDAHRTGTFVEAEALVDRLQQKLDAAKKSQKPAKPR
jgi:Arc/MetJ-type ribon-helix-helix transcriptional regulator